MLWIDLWCFLKIYAGVEKIGIPLNKGRVASLCYDRVFLKVRVIQSVKGNQ